MARSPRTLLLRLLSRALAPGKGEVRALEEALHLEGVVRFFALFVVTVVLPALLLGYLGIRSLRAEELDLQAEARRTANLSAGAFFEGLDREMTSFEDAVRTRLESGRSTLDSPKELHPDVVVALRFDRDLRLEAPFAASSTLLAEGPGPLDLSDWRRIDTLARSGVLPPDKAADAFAQVAADAAQPRVVARARFDRARMLARAGRIGDATAAFAEVADRYGTERDPWGFRYTDLVSLEVAELRLAEEPKDGAAALSDLVERLLSERWELGRGGEGAVARRALSTAEPWLAPDFVSGARGRIARRTAMLFWAEQLLPELDPAAAFAEAESTAPGAIRWRTGDRALWATTRWDDGLYAYAFDMQTLSSRLKADARGVVAADSPVLAFLLSPEDGEPTGVLERRSLAPYLTGWAVAVALEDPDALQRGQNWRRTLRFAVVALSVGMIALGFMFSLRMIGRELDVARMKADFAASVSHELRSPITQIRLKGESLMLGLADTDEERDEHYHAIVRESERLSRLVDNVLDFAAIERGAKSYTLRPGDLSQSVHRALVSMESSLEFRDMHLDMRLPDDLPAVHHDADAVAQCVINLVSNAAKYSPEGETIHVSARVVEGELPGGYSGPVVEVTVTDHGIGIAAHDLRSIFEPFYRSKDSLARRRKGTGIGLTITRYIMEAHGGTVAVQSKPGHGSTFSLRFPLEPPDGARRGSPRSFP
ncbi:MAG: HAMP domain-containing histidine kinase [Alphaproteobacteria bacterium]|nr:HAMP domain-containing histidine kinase [Alphaproteobacteria bacterium]